VTLPLARLEDALPIRPGLLPVLVGAAVTAVAAGALVAQQPVLGTATVLVAAAGLVTLARPDLATLVVLFLLFSNAVAVAVKFHGAPLTLAAFFPFLMIVPFAFYLYRGEPVIITPAFPFLLAFLVILVLSTIFSTQQDIGFERVKTFLIEGVVVYFLLTNVIRTPEVLRAVVWTLLGAAALLGGITLFQEVTGTYDQPYGGFGQINREFLRGSVEDARLSGPFGDPNYFAQALLIVVPLGLLTVWNERRVLLRAAAVGATVLVAAGIALTVSRGAAIAFLLILVLMAAFRYVRLYQLVGILLGVVVLLTAVPEYRERVSSLTSLGGATEEAGSSEGADESVRSRTTEMLAASLVFLDHPVLGVGPGAFSTFYQEYAGRIGGEVRATTTFGARRGDTPEREAHNLFLGLAADLGGLGLAALFALLVVTFRQLARARRHVLRIRQDVANVVTALMLGLAAYLTTGLFLTLAFERYFWMLLALCGAAASLALRLEAGPEPARRSSSARKNATTASS
jgi:putative inorganic carbon (hco3(-)) transporter